MFEETTNNLNNITDILIPSKEDINNISNKIKNNEELDGYDMLIIEKIRFCNHILKNKGGKI